MPQAAEQLPEIATMPVVMQVNGGQLEITNLDGWEQVLTVRTSAVELQVHYEDVDALILAIRATAYRAHRPGQRWSEYRDVPEPPVVQLQNGELRLYYDAGLNLGNRVLFSVGIASFAVPAERCDELTGYLRAVRLEGGGLHERQMTIFDSEGGDGEA